MSEMLNLDLLHPREWLAGEIQRERERSEKQPKREKTMMICVGIGER